MLTAVVTSSRLRGDLEAAGILDLFSMLVWTAIRRPSWDWWEAAPDIFLEAARGSIDPVRAVVVEDSRAGVEAGRAGGFGLVVGVDRVGQADELQNAGADLVVDDLAVFLAREADDQRRQPAGPRSHRLRAAATRLLAAADDFPVDEHRLVERRFNPEYVPQMESIFALANGYLGIRGTQDEGRPSYDPAPLLNGYYETWPIEYPESAYGFAETGQTVVGVPDGTVIRLYVDDEPFSVERAEVLEYERTLDMRDGVIERRVLWRARDGSRYLIRTRRMVSFTSRHLVCLEYEVTSLDRSAHLTLSSNLMLHPENGDRGRPDPRRTRVLAAGVLEKIDERVGDQQVLLASRTRASGLSMACGMDHQLVKGTPLEAPRVDVDGDWARVVYRFGVEGGDPVRIVKYLAYHHDGDEPTKELMFRAKQTLERAAAEGVRVAREEQRRFLEDFWERSDVIVEGAPLLQQAVRFNLFQLAQASARVEGYGIPAKGLTGQGYEGHYFWDAEIYTLPSWSTRLPLWPRISCAIVIVCWTKPGRGHVKSTSEEPCSPGVPSTGTRPRRTTQPARPSTTSTPTSLMRWCTTCGLRMTPSSWLNVELRSWWRRHACGRVWVCSRNVRAAVS